jgi:nitrous oxide reductase accessory protein NosL
MKQLLFTLIILLSTNINAEEMFTKRVSGEPTLIQEGAKKQWCPICGMSLKKFYKTSHTSAKGKHQYCSIRCLAVALEQNSSLGIGKVVDAKSEKLIDAKSAFYVVESDISGTMSEVSKIAFAKESDAKAFAEEYDGEVVDFQKAFDMAKKSLSSDIAMIMKKKKKMIYPMGKKIFAKKCQQDIELDKFSSINELKATIVNGNVCKNLKGMQSQAVTLYLWEVKRANILEKSGESITVSKDEKCPVCGMFTYKYPKWVAQIFYGDKHFSFDGVKDLMNFYFNPMAWGNFKDAKKENISKILVTDYYSQKVIDGTKAYYIIGSDVLGPMGNELIPFANKSDAMSFFDDHHGKSIIKFDKITQKEVKKLDE